MCEVGIPPDYDFFNASNQVRYSIAFTYDPVIYNHCNEYDINYCHKFLFGKYCVESVKKWYCENNFSATLREVYVVFGVHYNTCICIYSHSKDGIFRSTKVKSIPRCMCDGAPKHALTWCKYHMECKSTL